MAELVRYHGWNRNSRQWEFLCVTDGWINHENYKRELRQWSRECHFDYTCFAIEAWTREQQKQVERQYVHC